MPRRSSKHATLDRRMVVPTSGMDLSMPPNAIADNMLSRAYNWWYEPERGLCVRQGLAREDVAPLANPIIALHPYVNAAGALLLLCASNGKLKERNDDAWDDVTNISTAVHVSMTTFNGQALIADGAGTGLLKYDGTTAAYITDSPAKPMCVTSIANRVVCASADTPDYVYFSGANDLDDWATASPGTAVTIAAGFGDGHEITGLAVIYDLLVVSKVKRDDDGNIVGRRMYAISTAGTVESWYAKRISSENAAAWKGAMVGVGEMAYILDSNGFKAVSPTPNGQYGDIGVDAAIGVRINKFLTRYIPSLETTFVSYLHSLGQVWAVVGLGDTARIGCWHPVNGGFTTIDFGKYVPRAVCEVGKTVYVAGNDGVLYTLANQSGDELADGVLTPIYATVRTRVFEGLGGDLILKKAKCVFEGILLSTVLIEVWVPDRSARVPMGSKIIGEGLASRPVYDAIEDVVDATYKIWDNQSLASAIVYSGPRETGMAIQIRVIGGRVTLNSITGEFAVVGR